MPFVRVEILNGKTAEYKKTLLQAIHDALKISLEIEDDDRFARLYELDEDHFERRKAKTDRFTLIELTLLPGRSKELKRTVIKEITRLLAERLCIHHRISLSSCTSRHWIIGAATVNKPVS